MEDSDSVELVDMSRVTLFDIIYDMNRLQFAQELIKPPSNAGRSQKYNIISSRLCDNCTHAYYLHPQILQRKYTNNVFWQVPQPLKDTIYERKIIMSG